jgi:hypothetical protein
MTGAGTIADPPASPLGDRPLGNAEVVGEVADGHPQGVAQRAGLLPGPLADDRRPQKIRPGVRRRAERPPRRPWLPSCRGPHHGVVAGLRAGTPGAGLVRPRRPHPLPADVRPLPAQRNPSGRWAFGVATPPAPRRPGTCGRDAGRDDHEAALPIAGSGRDGTTCSPGSRASWGGPLLPAPQAAARLRRRVPHAGSSRRTSARAAGPCRRHSRHDPRRAGILVRRHRAAASHPLGVGHPDRFTTGSVEVRSDDEWMHLMLRTHRMLVTALTLPLLLHHRYPTSPSVSRERARLVDP